VAGVVSLSSRRDARIDDDEPPAIDEPAIDEPAIDEPVDGGTGEDPAAECVAATHSVAGKVSRLSGRVTAVELIRSMGLTGLVRPATEPAPARATTPVLITALELASAQNPATADLTAASALALATAPDPAMATVRGLATVSDLDAARALNPSRTSASGPTSETILRTTLGTALGVRMPSGVAAGVNAGNIAGGLGSLDRVLPVLPVLRRLLPGGGLRRGSTVATSGATSLLIALLAEASQAGSWCAVVGLPTLGAQAAAEAGIALDRLALVPYPGPEWSTVVAALLDGIDIVVAVPPGPIAASMSSRLAARARQRGSVLVAYGNLPGADLVLTASHRRWMGLDAGDGRLCQHEMTVVARGRGAAAQPRQTQIALADSTPINRAWDAGDWMRRNAKPAGTKPANRWPHDAPVPDWTPQSPMLRLIAGAGDVTDEHGADGTALAGRVAVAS
jgi:hypothetical protein